ncbi:hypothetical protein KP509_22G066200 [Ceratopteris richardii]|uniref:Uncharacterized protein n=1 Tax=Ceratopteris richardii TaxID=49495 RepID=A0A8T2S604_CERRI|nr:hypothetical protein KP509_22G066200 [Ceratopteris richardii]
MHGAEFSCMLRLKFYRKFQFVKSPLKKNPR